LKIIGRNLFILFLLLFSGCGRGYIQLKKEVSRQDSFVIPEVPFYKQLGNTCGPSALASILSYWGIKFDYEKLIKELYVPGLGGSLDFEIAFYPRKFNLWSKYAQENFSYLKERIREKIPLIVLQKELPIKGGYHYLVVFGFDDAKEKILVHTGRSSFLWLSYNSFFKKWEKADFGTITICPPEKVTWELEPEDYFYLGYLLERKEEWEKAEEIYQRLVEVLPQEKTIYFNLGNVYFQKGEYLKAEEAYKKAIALDKNFGDAYNNLAYLYLKTKKNLKEAEELIKKAIDIEPKKDYLDTLNQIRKEVGND